MKVLPAGECIVVVGDRVIVCPMPVAQIPIVDHGGASRSVHIVLFMFPSLLLLPFFFPSTTIMLYHMYMRFDYEEML